MNKGLFKKIAALALGLLLVLTGIFSGRGGIGRVRAAGTYTLTYTLGTATVENANISIRFLNGGAQIGAIEMVSIGTNVVEGGRNTDTKTGDIPAETTRVEIRVETAGQEKSGTITIGGVEQPISGDIGNGQIFDINDASANINVNMVLNSPAGGGNPGGGNPGGGGDPGIPPFDAPVPNGQYSLNISQDDYNGVAVVRFYDANRNVISTINATGDVAATNFPDGTQYIAVDFSADDNVTEQHRLHVKNCRLILFSNGSFSEELDGNDDIQYEDDTHDAIFMRWIDPNTMGVEIAVEFSDKKNVQLFGADNCQLYFSDAQGNIEEGVTDRNLVMGQTYYFKLIPDYGYQVRSLQINVYYTIAPMDAATGLFEFEMNAHNLHFAGIVSPSEDIVASSADSVAYVSVGNGEVAAENGGNLKIQVSSSETEDVSSVVSGDVLSTVDIGIENIVSKGDGNYWTSNVTDIREPLQMTLFLSGAENGTYSVVRNHNGVLTEIPAVFDPSTGGLTFDSNQFSTYTIVRTGDAVESDEDEESEETEEEIIYNQQQAQFRNDMANIFAGFSNSASGSDASGLENYSAYATSQGPLCQAAFKAAMPAGWTEGFSFNLTDGGVVSHDLKAGAMWINIPNYLRTPGRQFALLGIDKNGKVMVFNDLDEVPEVLAVMVNIEGYAFELIYKD